VFGSNKVTGTKRNSKNRLWSPISEGGVP